jgi:hypothetical protein
LWGYLNSYPLKLSRFVTTGGGGGGDDDDDDDNDDGE